MKHKKIALILAITLLASLFAGLALADDGAFFQKNVSGTPDLETERANLTQMNFYVPMQNANGRVLVEGTDTATIYYTDYFGDDATKVQYMTRGYAKPLVGVYIDSLPEAEAEEQLFYSVMSGSGLGQHDAFATVSLDDGHTWKATNLSNSAHLSSFFLEDGTPYPGDAHNMTFAIADDKVLVGWISKYCDEGNPFYRFSGEDIVALQTAYGLPDLYVHDIWGVNGKQGSVNYEEEGFPEVGEVPFSCVWSARGQLVPTLLTADATPGYEIVWLDAERLTSGERDANRLEMAADSASGFMMTWQEDPEGLRPGLGLGPGEGWSGAVVHQDTDLWYSFISVEHFDLVVDKGAEPVLTEAIPLTDFVAQVDAGTLDGLPAYVVPMAVPIRLSDNAKCMANGNSPDYCYVNFDDENPWLTELGDDALGVLPEFTPTDGYSTFCADNYLWDTPGGSQIDVCIAEDGRYLSGRVGASRPRVNVQPYNSAYVVDDETDIEWYDGGIVIMGAEESKALGALELLEIDEIEIGKNMMYYSFDLANPSFVLQGGQLNWPAKDPATGETFPILTDDFGLDFYDTEIARRFSHMSQAPHQIGESGVSAVLIVKQGILNQGGPADIFLRFPVADMTLDFACELDGDTTTIEQCFPEGYNPYAYQNMRCDTWEFADGTNPRYLEGYCISPGTNISGVYAFCNGGDCGDFPYDGGVEFPKVTTWDQDVDNLDDESWENPWDVSKGHRGFIDGDFIMAIYAWAPNWKANSVGNDHYNLYQRRSFDGGLTWTTTPAALGGTGTTTCENYLDDAKTVDCTTYAAGEFEKSRNLSQLIGNRETILDPRYSPTGGLKMLTAYDKYELNSEVLPYADDAVRDPSKYFVVYETGDNTTVEEGEAVPMDLFYARATMYGDFFDLVEKYNATTEETVYVFDWLEHDEEFLSGEAANTCNAGGTFYYAIWNQWQEDAEENVSNSDAFFNRAMWLSDDVELDPAASLLYVSTLAADQSEDETIILVGTAKAFGATDIVQYRWMYDGEVLEGCEKQCNVPSRTLHPGWGEFSFDAQDGRGNWSKPVGVKILIAEELTEIHLPLIQQ